MAEEQWTVTSVDGKEVSKQEEQPATEEVTDNVKQEEDAVQEQQTEEVPVGEQTDDSPEVDEEVRSESPEEEDSPLELISEEKTEVDEKADSDQGGVEQQPEAAAAPPQQEEVQAEAQAQVELPENVDKLVKFMEETGGNVEDYVNLNKDISALDDVNVIKEYYRQKYPHFDEEDVSFKMDDQFLYNEEEEDPRAVRSKKLAFKEELYEARKFLEGRKEKYYADLKLNKQNNITPEHQEAFSFYNEYKQTQESNQKLVDAFQKRTDEVFQDLKGFDFKVGENKYRFKVSDADNVKKYQSDLNNLIGEFVGEDGSITDAAGYHKALFAAKNADKIAQHFYEQGRADAIQNTAKSAKNIDMTGNKDASSVVTSGGTTYKVVSGDTSSRLKFKIRK